VLVVYAVENGRGYCRLGISISRKKVRAASGRNRLKRLVREAFRLGKQNLPPSLDLVVVPRAKNPSFAEVKKSLETLSRILGRRLRSGKPRTEQV
jgi:ribonuclease P protein component